MASTLDIKRRIKSVNSTGQITKAMNLVAASKLQRAKAKVASTRPFFLDTQRVIASVVANSQGITHPFLAEREVKNTLVIVIAGDRGLCGGYNANAIKAAIKVIGNKEKVAAFPVGKKAKEFFNRTMKDSIQSELVGITENPSYADAVQIAKTAVSAYAAGEVDAVYLVYTEFKSVLSHEPKAIRLLPVDTEAFAQQELAESESKSLDLMLYEPGEEEVLDYLIPKYVNTVIYGALAESSASELGARMTAMDSATENAYEMIESLTLQFNRARQGAITQEITEIVSGANALS